MKNSEHWFLSGDVEPAVRFSAFTGFHLIYLIVGAAVIIMLARYVKRQKPEQAEKVIKTISLILIPFYFLRAAMFYQYYENFSFLDIAPLHLCIISGFVLPVTVFTGHRLLWNLAYSVLMPGALTAIITPEVTLNSYHAFGWMPVIFFGWHFLVVMIPILQIAAGRLIPDLRLYPQVVLVLCGYAIFIYILNKRLGTNYLYLNGAARGTVLELFQNWLGNPGYIVPMAALVLLVSFLLFLPWRGRAA